MKSRERPPTFRWAVIVTIVLLLGFVEGIKVSPNGGYAISVAIAKATNQPEDLLGYIQNIQWQLGNFSKHLFEATNRRFYVETINLIVPYHWEVEEEEVAILENYDTADLRLNKDFDAIHVENNNLCDLAGEYIEVPLHFFSGTSGIYGEPAKALLGAWARYRWGTWEEHGYPGDDDFPYFYNPSGNTWVPTGCSDTQVEGTIINIKNNLSCPTNDKLYSPGTDCRFLPFNNSTSTSSLAYLHWLPTVTRFCDSTNHNQDAPSKQNLYCAHRSVLEVMETSEDFLDATEPPLSEDPPECSFTITIENRQPLFYFVVDESFFPIPKATYDIVLTEIKKLFQHRFLKEIPGKAIVFKENSMGQEIIPWTLISQDLDGFNGVTDRFRGERIYDRPGDFLQVIFDVVQEIVSLENPAGAVVLMLKHGLNTDALGKKVFESELVNRLREEKIVFHALEIQNNAIDPRLNLEKLVQGSGGFYLPITPTSDVVTETRGFVTKISKSLEIFEVTSNIRTIFKGYLTNDAQFTLPISTFPENTKFKFTVTVDKKEALPNPSRPLIYLSSGQQAAIQFLEQTHEFNDAINCCGRFVLIHKMIFPESTASANEEWSFVFEGCGATCKAWIDVTYEYPEDYIVIEDAMQVEVRLSQTNYVPKESKEPLKIFAKLTRDGQPLVGINEVVATLHNYDLMESFQGVALTDDGPNAADVSRDDGVYSGIINPPTSGTSLMTFFVTVSVRGTVRDLDYLEGHIHSDAAIHRLIPENQVEIGCASKATGCAVTLLEDDAVIVTQVKNMLTVIPDNAAEIRSARILDLHANAWDKFIVNLTWTVPDVFGGSLEDIEKKFKFEVKSSSNAEELYTGAKFEGLLAEKCMEDDFIYEPGQSCGCSLDKTDATGKIFFAVRLSKITGGDSSLPSNIQGLIPVETPTTTTTTMRVPPTAGPSTSPGPSTTPEETTMTTEYQESSSSEMSTTPGYTYWYETTEGIVTLSVFSVGIVVLIGGFVLFRFLKSGKNGIRRQAKSEGLPYAMHET